MAIQSDSYDDTPETYPQAKRRSRLALRIAIWFFAATIALPILLVLIFRVVPPPTTTVMLGTALMEGPVTQRWVPLESISRNLVRAVIASEDGKFCSHWGFDWDAINNALEDNAAGSRLRGASTISQQTAKNLFLTLNRTWFRKGAEAYLTVLIEALWPKQRIMETYLNIVEFGPRRFGAQAAAEGNFGKSAANLTALEAARLATVLPNPKVYRADQPGPYVTRQSAVVYARMGDVTRDQLDACVFR
ncbi:MAG: monofunctional biosynthetic peptidoglycan transglycosylase [Alphaproteobacteria bacterium]|nr:monofunctional biosynthetic peptidoglycan transglycosylase [Alphaproteobacteria bacterium]